MPRRACRSACRPWPTRWAAAPLTPLFRRLEAHVLSAERLHGDDTTVPVLAKGKTDIGRITGCGEHGVDAVAFASPEIVATHAVIVLRWPSTGSMAERRVPSPQSASCSNSATQPEVSGRIFISAAFFAAEMAYFLDWRWQTERMSRNYLGPNNTSVEWLSSKTICAIIRPIQDTDPLYNLGCDPWTGL
jgi:hypothetical protein